MTGGLSLAFEVPDRSPLDEPLVIRARLTHQGSDKVTTSSRLNLLEGDLSVAVTPPGGSPAQVVWPWPLDSARREASLRPGEALEGGVLLHWAIGGPVFGSAGRYTVHGEFAPLPLEAVAAPPAAVLRDDASAPSGLACQHLLLDPDVARSLASASVLGSAASGLAELASRGAAVTRFLATLALGDPAAVGGLAAAADPVDVATWTTAVLPAGLFGDDPRVRTVANAVAGDERAAAILSAQPR
jgi:hypothetical protein